MRDERIVRRQVFSKSTFDNRFNDIVCFFVITVLNVLSTQNEFARLLHI